MQHRDATFEWPELALHQWERTYLTLHRWLQIVGKVRLFHAPWLNHWWHVPLYVTSQGLTTLSMPSGSRHFTITFDFCDHRLLVHTSDNRTESFALQSMSVASFYDRVTASLRDLEIETHIHPVPTEVVDTTPFTEDRHHATYDPEPVENLHQLLLNVHRVFGLHRSRFVGKCSPIHFFWGAFDLAVTRFSGRRNPNPPTAPIMAEAYSHEVISHGFWPGGDWPIGGRVAEPVFYAYAIPEPEGFRRARVLPRQASFSETLGEFLLPYNVVRTARDPDLTLLQFMESTYLAAAERAGWDIAALSCLRPSTHAQAEMTAKYF